MNFKKNNTKKSIVFLSHCFYFKKRKTNRNFTFEIIDFNCGSSKADSSNHEGGYGKIEIKKIKIKKTNAHRQLKIFKRTIPQCNATNWFAKCARTKCFICGIKQSEYKLKEKAETNNNNNRDKLRNLGRRKKKSLLDFQAFQ